MPDHLLPACQLTELTAVILVGGLGTRLRAAVAEVPKSMAPVNGRPFLDYLLAQLRDAGIVQVVLCAGYLGQTLQAHYNDGAAVGLRLRYSFEERLQGTAGALREAQPLIASDPVLVLNGDSYCTVSLPDLLAVHQARSAQATMAVTSVADCSRYGQVTLDATGAVRAFAEKESASGAGYINGGIYLLAHRVLAAIPADRPVSLEREIFPALIGHGLVAMPTAGLFIDIGTPESFAQAQTLLASALPATP